MSCFLSPCPPPVRAGKIAHAPLLHGLCDLFVVLLDLNLSVSLCNVNDLGDAERRNRTNDSPWTARCGCEDGRTRQLKRRVHPVHDRLQALLILRGAVLQRYRVQMIGRDFLCKIERRPDGDQFLCCFDCARRGLRKGCGFLLAFAPSNGRA